MSGRMLQRLGLSSVAMGDICPAALAAGFGAGAVTAAIVGVNCNLID